jgi:hypothetical protein
MSDNVHMRPGLFSFLLLLAGTVAVATAADGRSPRAPKFPTSRPGAWIGTPVTWEGLRGRVVMLDVWTFG